MDHEIDGCLAIFLYHRSFPLTDRINCWIEVDNTRHTLSYIAPVDEPGGGSAVPMVQQSDEVLQMMPGSERKKENGVRIEFWQHCKPIA
ncbi:hypothetical protein MnTg02_00458 [bacterium MnTg02]|nr:hypothetical protein MnTg02_00458 [bacterium MnTg02]